MRHEVVLVNPPSPFLKDQLVMPPLGIMYLSSFLKSFGVDTVIHDMAVTKKQIPEANITAFTATTPQYLHAVEATEEVAQHITRTVIGGAHASSFGNCREFDYEVHGEGELALYNIVMNNIYDTPLPRIHKGIPIENLDVLPFPDRYWDGFKNYHYDYDGMKFTTAMTSRGCPYNCAFCFSMLGKKVRNMSVGRVIAEAVQIQNMGFDGIMYYDDTFAINEQRTTEIAQGLNNLEMKFRCFTRANTINEKLLQILKKNGCVELGMGVESGSQKILDTVSKGVKVSDCENAIQMCRDAKIKLKIFLMIGLPGETAETIKATKQFILWNQPDDYDISIYTPFPQTKLWDMHSIGASDIEYKEPIDYNHMFYKSVEGRYKSNVRTKALSFEEIEHARHELEELKKVY